MVIRAPSLVGEHLVLCPLNPARGAPDWFPSGALDMHWWTGNRVRKDLHDVMELFQDYVQSPVWGIRKRGSTAMVGTYRLPCRPSTRGHPSCGGVTNREALVVDG